MPGAIRCKGDEMIERIFQKGTILFLLAFVVSFLASAAFPLCSFLVRMAVGFGAMTVALTLVCVCMED
jgi:hypothetical protein